MTRTGIGAVLAAAAIALLPTAANAATVGPGANGGHAELDVGQTLTINLKPANSGSTGYHWDFSRKPSAKLLRLTSDHASSDGKRQVLRYKARGAGITSLKLRYRPPGHGKSVKTFRLAVLVNEPEPALDCSGIPDHANFSLVARSGTADVFKIRRVLFFWQGSPARAAYDAYYGCELSQQHAFRLGGVIDRKNPHEFLNVTLRGTAVAYVHDKDCPFDNRAGCDGIERTVESQDLHTGNLIRSVGVSLGIEGSPDVVTGLVESPSGGVAWIEQGKSPEGPVQAFVRRSDAAAAPGEPYAHDSTTLDDGQHGTVDPDSLLFDGTRVTWTRDGHQQQAPLH